MDRFATNGDSQVGFWFVNAKTEKDGFGNVIGLNGPHHASDVLVLSDFVKGGKVPDIRAYRWVGSGGSDGPLDLLGSSADCEDVPHADPRLCATVNEGAETPPWTFLRKGKGDTSARITSYNVCYTKLLRDPCGAVNAGR